MATIVELKKQKNSLVRNINLARKRGMSKSKAKSTISKQAYSNMKKNWKS